FQPPRPQETLPTRQFSHHDVGSSTSSGTSQWSTSAGTPSSLAGERGDIVDHGVITKALAQILLDRFRTNAIRQFPFVVIPDDSSLETVRKKTPFLFLAVVATMIFDNPFLQHQLGEELRQQAFQKILSGNEK